MTSSSQKTSEAHRKHILLTLLGDRHSSAQYQLDDSKLIESSYAPAALWQLLPPAERPHEIYVLCTKEAKANSLPAFQESLKDVPLTVIDLDQTHDVNLFLTEMTTRIAEDTDLTVDLTHGFRHLSLLIYVATLYLTALKGIQLKGAYYAMLTRDAPSPFLNLKPLLELPQWFHALQVLDETGSTKAMAALFQGAASKRCNQSASLFEPIARAFLAGLPLDLGASIEQFLQQKKTVKKALRTDLKLPLSDELSAHLEKTLQPFALSESPKDYKQQGFKNLTLSAEELSRQAELIEALFAHQNIATAVRLLAEWTTSWAIWAHDDKNERATWLDYGQGRRQANERLRRLVSLQKAQSDFPTGISPLSKEQQALAVFFDDISEIRNAFAHNGMKPQVIIGKGGLDGRIAKVQHYFAETLQALPRFSLSPKRTAGAVLISPLGRLPGSLFSAARTAMHCGKLDQCVVICSEDTQAQAQIALQEAGFKGETLLWRVQPFAAETEFARLNAAFGNITSKRREQDPEGIALKSAFYGAREVLVNVTGGTTLMGLLADAMASQAGGMGLNTHRFGLVDGRPHEEQKAHPFAEGQAFWLDGQPAQDAHADANLKEGEEP